MIVAFLAAVLLVVVPGAARAHGEHGGAAALGGAGPVRIGSYWVEILSHPAPLVTGQAGHLVVKLSADPSGAPLSGAHVLVGLDPAAEPGHTHSGGAGGGDLAEATEVTWAGQYERSVTPARVGAYRARVLLAEVAGQRMSPPLVVDFPIAIEKPPGMAGWAWTLVAFVAGLGVAGLYAFRLRARVGATTPEPLNLLDIPWLRRVLTAPGFQPALQAPLLVLMVVVVFVGLGDVQDGGVNFATKLTWTIWWAGVIFTFVLLGRVWCLACPFGALNEWTARLTAPLRRLPRAFRNIWWATGMFVLLTWADEQLGVVRSPRVTAWIVLLFAGLAVAVGLFYERRSFCRYLCPIGGVIGLYSMTAPLELRAQDAATCRSHRDKACYQGGAGSFGCPMFEFPQAMDRNNYCTLCVECVKGCARDNLALRFRAFGRDLWASGRRAMDESYLAVALVGLTYLVTAQMLPAWSAWSVAAAGWLPAWVRGSVRPVTYLGAVESATLVGGALVIVPLLVLLGAALADRRAAPDGLGLRRTFVVFGYMFVPIGLAMHLAHNLAHLLLEGGGIVPATQRVIALYTPFSLGNPEWPAPALASGSVVALLQMAVLVAFFLLSLRAGYQLALRAYPSPRTASRALVPMAALSVIFTVIGIVLLNQPMGMRHGP
jgi:polyferredoxin